MNVACIVVAADGVSYHDIDLAVYGLAVYVDANHPGIINLRTLSVLLLGRKIRLRVKRGSDSIFDL